MFDHRVHWIIVLCRNYSFLKMCLPLPQNVTLLVGLFVSWFIIVLLNSFLDDELSCFPVLCYSFSVKAPLMVHIFFVNSWHASSSPTLNTSFDFLCNFALCSILCHGQFLVIHMSLCAVKVDCSYSSIEGTSLFLCASLFSLKTNSASSIPIIPSFFQNISGTVLNC